MLRGLSLFPDDSPPIHSGFIASSNSAAQRAVPIGSPARRFPAYRAMNWRLDTGRLGSPSKAVNMVPRTTSRENVELPMACAAVSGEAPTHHPRGLPEHLEGVAR